MQTYQQFADKHALTLHYQERSTRPGADTWGKSARHYSCEILHREQMTGFEFYFSMGMGRKDGPEIAEVLQCLASDAHGTEQSFEDWCADMGLNDDSRKAFAMYEACENTRQDLNRILGDDGLNELFYETNEEGDE